MRVRVRVRVCLSVLMHVVDGCYHVFIIAVVCILDVCLLRMCVCSDTCSLLVVSVTALFVMYVCLLHTCVRPDACSWWISRRFDQCCSLILNVFVLHMSVCPDARSRCMWPHFDQCCDLILNVFSSCMCVYYIQVSVLIQFSVQLVDVTTFWSLLWFDFECVFECVFVTYVCLSWCSCFPSSWLMLQRFDQGCCVILR
jgi:hypothetical protein